MHISAVNMLRDFEVSCEVSISICCLLRDFELISQTPSTGLRHPSFKEEGVGKRCSECGDLLAEGHFLKSCEVSDAFILLRIVEVNSY